jgi:anaerobic magnesium-protoporphyrin IX monomethyl ester cyclase
MRVAFIFPNINYRRIAKEIVHPPLGIAYLAAILREQGHEVRVFDAAVANLDFDELERLVRGFEPAIIGLTTNVATAAMACYTARVLKKSMPRSTIIFGGPWATIEAEAVIRKRLADIVVMGEGEETVVQLASVIEKGGGFESVDGITFCNETGTTIKTKTRPFIKDLDSLPFPAWDLLPASKHYHYNNRYYPYYPILTSRGCPFDCIYCTKVVHGYKMRYRSVENVIAEIRFLKEEYKIKELIIADDNFTQDPLRAEKIFDRIYEENLDIKIIFSNGIRSDIYSERLVAKMKRAGVYRVFLGIESGNQFIVNRIRKGLRLDDVRGFVTLLRKYRIEHWGYFMLGLPGDTPATMMDTIRFSVQQRIKPHFHKTIAVPGTKLYDQVKGCIQNRGLLFDASYSKAGATFESYPGQGKDMQLALRRGYAMFYFNPRTIINLLSETRTLQDILWVFNSSLRILEMALGKVFERRLEKN